MSTESVLPTIVSQRKILDFNSDISADRVHLYRLVLRPTVTVGMAAALDPDGKHFVASLILYRYDEEGEVLDTLSTPFDRMLSSDLVRKDILTAVWEMLDGDFVPGIERAVTQTLIQSIATVNLMYDYNTQRFECLVWTEGDTLEFSVDFSDEVQQYLALKNDDEEDSVT